MNLGDALLNAGAPRRQPEPAKRPQSTPWQIEWASRNRDISRRIKAAEAAKNDARCLQVLRTRSRWNHGALAAVMGVNHDWLRKTVLPRLERRGVARRIIVINPKTGWPLRWEWEAI